MKLASLYFREYFMISFENMCQAILPSSTEVGFLPFLNCAQLPKIWLDFYSRLIGFLTVNINLNQTTKSYFILRLGKLNQLL